MGPPLELHEVQRPGRRISKLVRPRSVAEALDYLVSIPGARPIAGGTDLLLDLQRGGPGEDVPLIDLGAIEGFRSIDEQPDAFVLGGGVTHNQVVLNDRIRLHCLPLAQACVEVGSPQLRNRATIAGNLVTASPANDTISALMALGAEVELARPGAAGATSRTVRVDSMFEGFRQTVLEPDELIVSIRVPKLGPDQRGLWVKLGLRRAQAISVVHAGLVIGLADGEVSSVRLAMGSVAPTVVIVPELADALVGFPLDEEHIARAAAAAAAAVKPIDDVRATAVYRTQGIATLIERSLRTLAADEQASMWLYDPPALAAPHDLSKPASAPKAEAGGSIAMAVNGSDRTGDGGTLTLLDWLRQEASTQDAPLTGAKEGCAEGECGACTVLLDGSAVMSCLVAAGQADGGTVVTIEGLSDSGNGNVHPLQAAFVDEFAVQCGFCIPGFLVAGARLLAEIAEPNDEQISMALSGNLCRCTGYYPIIDAVHRAGEAMS